MSEQNIKIPKTRVETFSFGPWTIFSHKSHILQSFCASPDDCQNVKRSQGAAQAKKLCTFCRYETELQLPQLPDMTFGDNAIRIVHENGCGIEFNCLDALKLVNSTKDLMKVAIAQLWQQSRAESEHMQHVIKPFDWTFTNNYMGTLISSNTLEIRTEETLEVIDMEKLKVKDKIMFYDDVHLFEDELADNGTAQLSVKIRVMNTCYFVLLRYFLRIDNLQVRINDTRLFHEAGANYILREYTSRESKIADLKASVANHLTDPNELWPHLPIVDSQHQKLVLPN